MNFENLLMLTRPLQTALGEIFRSVKRARFFGRTSAYVGGLSLTVMLASITVPAASPAGAASLAGLHYLVGSWSCTYRAGTARFAYATTYAYDGGGRTLRQIASWTGGGDEELLAYDPAHKSWTAVVLDDHGTATVMRGTGADPNHIAYRSTFPDASIAETFDHISATEYTLHATVRSSGKTITSVDTCLRTSR